MRVSTVARVVRIPVFAAALVAPMLAGASVNDPVAPNAQAPRASTSVASSDDVGRAGGSIPWFRGQTDRTSGGSIPWFKSETTRKAGGSIPWF